jgi:hypothetical protein
MTNFYQAIKAAVKAAFEEYRFVRHMQKGGNPDILPF